VTVHNWSDKTVPVDSIRDASCGICGELNHTKTWFYSGFLTFLPSNQYFVVARYICPCSVTLWQWYMMSEVDFMVFLHLYWNVNGTCQAQDQAPSSDLHSHSFWTVIAVHRIHSFGFSQCLIRMYVVLLLLLLWVPSAYASRSTSALCFRKYLSLMAYCTIPVLDFPTFPTSSALPRPLSRETWSCKPVI
jgi:hypothetical protein